MMTAPLNQCALCHIGCNINDNRKVTMNYVTYYELITDENDKKRVIELSVLREEAIVKADYDKVSE